MRELHQPPRASAIIGSLRALGYSFNTAIADIIDNSVAAKATKVTISFDVNPDWVGILDNGVGMSQRTLLAAMRHGGFGPDEIRQGDDLGRYGLGLKTASLSQCRKLTVATLHDGKVSGAQWDLDEVQRRDDWILQLLDEDEIQELPGYDDLFRGGHGTLVLWQQFDRATAGAINRSETLKALVLDAGPHLALVFHRFISKTFGQGLEIAINNRIIEAADPFILGNPQTEVAGEETRIFDGHKVSMKAYILPHISRITAEQMDRAGGKERLRDTQGFYIYRQGRLITYGTWFRLIARDELTRLARIQVDIPNALDHMWGLDVKKSTAHPPEAVRVVLRQIISTVSQKSANVFQERLRRPGKSDFTFIWLRALVRGGVRYAINRDHPLVAAMKDNLPDLARARFDRFLGAIENNLPTRSIYLDQAQNETIEQGSTEGGSQLRLILDDLLASLKPLQQQALLEQLRFVEPFSRYPDLLASLVQETMKDA